MNKEERELIKEADELKEESKKVRKELAKAFFLDR